jgi:hypothetical protein
LLLSAEAEVTSELDCRVQWHAAIIFRKQCIMISINIDHIICLPKLPSSPPQIWLIAFNSCGANKKADREFEAEEYGERESLYAFKKVWGSAPKGVKGQSLWSWVF